MIEARQLSMTFDGFEALHGLNCTISEGSVYGLIGSNGAGKSTFLRLLAGIYRPAEGEVLYDGVPVYDNPAVKSQIFFLSDELYFLPRATMDKMARFYENLYPSFRMDRYRLLTQRFGLNPRASVSTFSKGMRRQAAIILALSVRPQYLFFDETFDGLDPVMRNLVKEIITEDIKERGSTAIIASHSLRELEDVCDQLSLLHKGGIVLESQMGNLKTSLCKVQIALDHPFDRTLFSEYDLVSYHQSGSVAELTVRGEQAALLESLRSLSPVVLEPLPLGLEEVFIHEMSALGYSFSGEPKEGDGR